MNIYKLLILSELPYVKYLKEFLASPKNLMSVWTLTSDHCIQIPAQSLGSDAILAGSGASASASIKWREQWDYLVGIVRLNAMKYVK